MGVPHRLLSVGGVSVLSAGLHLGNELLLRDCPCLPTCMTSDASAGGRCRRLPQRDAAPASWRSGTCCSVYVLHGCGPYSSPVVPRCVENQRPGIFMLMTEGCDACKPVDYCNIGLLQVSWPSLKPVKAPSLCSKCRS